jgi:trimethylamine--corrinoid protein Co-methyltransferase
MDLALTLAEAGIPISFYPMPILGATAPITIAGAAVVNNAELVSGAALVQLAFPGAKIIHGGGPTAMYMDSGAYASNSPEALMLRGIQGQMADFYGMPSWFGAGATTAKEPGVQSAYENTMAMMTAYMSGADVTFGTGLLDGSRILALEQVVTDNEIFGMVTRILRGVEVSEETLAKELIVKMGFSGNFLFEQHTRRHVREMWRAQLGETGNVEAWKAAGAKTTVEKAQEKVAEVLAGETPPFPEELAREFDDIMAAVPRR